MNVWEFLIVAGMVCVWLAAVAWVTVLPMVGLFYILGWLA